MVSGVDPNYERLTRRIDEENRAFFEQVEPSEPPAVATTAQKAANLEELEGAIYLYGSTVPIFNQSLGVEGAKIYVDKLLQEAGKPKDPVERLLLHQLVLAHHSIGKLLSLAATRTGFREVQIYHAAASRLMGEFRRSALALQTYRAAAQAGGAGKAFCGANEGAGANKINTELPSNLNGFHDHQTAVNA